MLITVKFAPWGHVLHMPKQWILLIRAAVVGSG